MIESLTDTADRLRTVRQAYEQFLAMHALDELMADGTARLAADVFDDDGNVREPGDQNPPPRFSFLGGPLDD